MQPRPLPTAETRSRRHASIEATASSPEEKKEGVDLMRQLIQERRLSPEFARMKSAIESAANEFAAESTSPDFWKLLESSTIHLVPYPELVSQQGQSRGDALQFYLEQSELESLNGNNALQRIERDFITSNKQPRNDTEPPMTPIQHVDTTPSATDETIDVPLIEMRMTTFHTLLNEAEHPASNETPRELYEEAYLELMRIGESTDPNANLIINEAFTALSIDQKFIFKHLEHAQRRKQGIANSRYTPETTPPLTPLPLIRTDAESLTEQRLRDLVTRDLRTKQFPTEQLQKAQKIAIKLDQFAETREWKPGVILPPSQSASYDTDAYESQQQAIMDGKGPFLGRNNTSEDNTLHDTPSF